MSTITTTTQPATSSPLKRLIIDHPLVTFFVIAFGGAWIIWLPLILAQNGLGLFPYTIPDLPFYPQSYWFAALSAVMGPTLAAFSVTAVISGKAGVQQMLRRYTLWRVGIRWYLLILVGVPFAFLLCSSVLLGVSPLLALIQKWPLYFTLYLPNVLIIVLAVQIWEETGWSGFATPNLQKSFGAVRAALILGPLWALWHLPSFFVPGQIFEHKVGIITMIVQMVLLVIFATLTRIIMIWVFNNTKGSLLIAILLHASLDATNSASAFITHLLSHAQLGGFGFGNILAIFVGALLILIFTRGRLSYHSGRVEKQKATPRPNEESLTNV